MATLTDRTYFPPLEECLSGRRIILSWKIVASSLEDSSSDRLASAAVSAFLRDGYVQQLLKEPTRPFEPPSNQSKLDFETKTGAINIVPSPTDPYDLDTIKGDARWLSKNANVNEVAALRIVLVEYQSRARSHLTGPLSTQDVANIQEAAGVTDAQASGILAFLNVTTVADAESTWADFESETRRRQRLLATYLSERRSFLSAADGLITFLLHSRSSTAYPEANVLRQAVMKDAFDFDDAALHPDMSQLDSLAPTYIGILDDCMNRAREGPAAMDQQIMTAQLEVDWVRTALTEAIHAMSLTFQILDLKTPAFTAVEVVSRWFAFVNTYEFLEPVVGDHELIAELVMPLRSMVTAISLKLLNIDRALLYLTQEVDLLENEDSYIDSTDALTHIHTVITAAANACLMTAAPVVFAWSLILHQMHLNYQERAERRDLLQNQRAQAGFELEFEPSGSGRPRRNSAGSIVSIETSQYDAFLVSQQLERDIQLAENMAMVVTSQGSVYDVMSEMAVCLGGSQVAAFRPIVGARARIAFLDLLKGSVHVIGYRSEPVSCLLSVLSAGTRYWDMPLESANGAARMLYARMLEQGGLRDKYTAQSQSRFPYEFLPFSSLCRILSAALVSDEEKSEVITGLLLRTPSLTVDWNSRWDTSYELVNEDENTNSFRLTHDIDLFDSTSRSKRRFSPDEKLTIPAGTFGRFVTDVGRVCKLEFEHSALALFGKRLEVNLMGVIYDSGLAFLTGDEVIEGISLIATVLRADVLRASAPSKADSDQGMRILREASRLLPRAKDIISVVCDTMDSLIEEELADLDGPKIAALSSCVQFLHATLPVCPGRVWAYMSRCALLNSDTRAGRLSKVMGNLDMAAERFDLLLSAVKLFSSLVESSMTSAVQRRIVTNLNSRPKGEESPWLGTSDKILSRVTLSIAQTAIDIFESSATWRFTSEVDRSSLVRDVVGIMHKLLSYTYSIGSTDVQQSLTSTLAPAAGYIVESFLSTSSSSLRFQPLLATLLAAFQLPDSTLYPQRSRIVSERLTSVLEFATILLRVADHLDQPSAVIQSQLFKSASLVARLPAVRHSFRMPAISLLSALVESAGKASGEPPSLLGYLGPQISRSFIQIASQLDKPFDRTPEVAGTWRFFSTIVRSRQQWMANCLLTGKTPREALKGDAKISQLTAGSVLSAALEKLRSISNIPSQESLAVLDFFTAAQNYWPWTIFAMQKDKAFLQDLRTYVRELKSPTVIAKAEPAEAGYQARIAAYIAETFAMQLYHLRQMRQEQGFATDLVNDLDYFLRDGVHVSGYNASLHANFARNFAKRYPGCSVDDFKRTLLVARDLGSNYYYDLDFAESMLRYDAGWAGSRQNGFRREMETANLNLSLVEAQVALFRAWEYLLLELSICLLRKNPAVAKQMLQVAEQCLEANQRPQPPENIFVVLSHSRANLALTVLQRLADCSRLPRDITQLLMLISATIYGVENPFSQGQISYFRTLLKILFVILRSTRHSANSPASKSNNSEPETHAAVTQLVLNILERVVARSFRTLAALVHEPDSPTTPEDLALLTAVLQACLSVPGIDQCQVQVLNIMASHDILQVATSLFSWSDRLTSQKGDGSNNDPVYGELALLFLLELSALPLIAEQLANDNLLGHLTSANLSGYMRRENVSPFADDPGAARCYAIWAKGILPLLLNILGVVGATFAPEVAIVLNQFPNLLRSSAERLEAPGLSRTATSTTAAATAKASASSPPSASSTSMALQRHGGGPQFLALVAISEVHSLALLTRVLAKLRMNNNRDIPEVAGWDAGAVLENVEFWLASRKLLRERLLPLGPREVEWRRMAPVGEAAGCANRLEEKAVGLLEGVRDVLADALAEEGGE